MKCRRCGDLAQVALPSHHTGFCPACFETYYLRQIERAIHEHRLLQKEEKTVLAVSGGKDSLGLLLALDRLGYDVTALFIDLAIPESSAQAREVVEFFCHSRGIKLHVLETAAHGLAIPEVKRHIRRPVCSVCGKIKRHFFNRYAYEAGFEVLATGHNLDDEVARLFANTLRWDPHYLAGQGPRLDAQDKFVRKIKPLCRVTEYESAAWCFFNGIEHTTVPCPYSVGASFTGHKRLLADLERKSPGMKMQFYEHFLKRGQPCFQRGAPSEQELVSCEVCGFPSSQNVCSVCRLRGQLAAKREAAHDA
ncbi:ATP-binding protein [Fundidesulfovibrio butyratiphilus]